MAIYKNKGNKKFRNKPPSVVLKNLASKEVHRYYFLGFQFNNHSSSWEKMEEMYRKRLTTTMY